MQIFTQEPELSSTVNYCKATNTPQFYTKTSLDQVNTSKIMVSSYLLIALPLHLSSGTPRKEKRNQPNRNWNDHWFYFLLEKYATKRPAFSFCSLLWCHIDEVKGTEGDGLKMQTWTYAWQIRAGILITSPAPWTLQISWTRVHLNQSSSWLISASLGMFLSHLLCYLRKECVCVLGYVLNYKGRCAFVCMCVRSLGAQHTWDRM